MMRISVLHRLLDTVSPRRCTMCGGRLGVTEEWLCTVCNRHLPRTGYSREPYGNAMARLLWGRIPVEKCAAWFFYKSHSESSHAIYMLKYGNRPDIGERLGAVAAADFAHDGFFDGIDLLIPLPLDKTRLKERGYNQSERIAKGVSSATGIPLGTEAVCRTSFKDSQTHKNLTDRQKNVEDAFSLNAPELVRNHHVLLIDDIITTGATVCACAKELMKAGGVSVSIMALGYSCDQFRMVNNEVETQQMFGATIDDLTLDDFTFDDE